MSKHSTEFVEIFDYVLIDEELRDLCLEFDSVDIRENTAKWEYVKTAMKTMDKNYKIYKYVPFHFVSE